MTIETPVRPAEPALACARANSRAILAMMLGMAFFVVSDTLVKMAGDRLPVGQIMTFRGVFASAIILAIGAAVGAFAGAREVLTGRSGRLVAWRTLGEVGAALTFFCGLLSLPFADASAIGQFIPLAVTAGAAIFLAEPVGWRRWLATLAGFIGVLIIIQPGTTAFRWESLWIVACVLFVTLRDLVTRRLGNGPHPVLLTTVSAIAVAAFGLVLWPFETWVAPSLTEYVYLFFSAVGVLGGIYGVIVAIRTGDISVVGPFRYSVIVYAVIVSIVVFGERPAWTTYLGIAIVMAAGLYTFHREQVRRREAERRVAAAG
jgi:drug/metabolite transporter (DMT)-like permease